jgi:hypothetical protein
MQRVRQPQPRLQEERACEHDSGCHRQERAALT